MRCRTTARRISVLSLILTRHPSSAVRRTGALWRRRARQELLALKDPRVTPGPPEPRVLRDRPAQRAIPGLQARRALPVLRGRRVRDTPGAGHGWWVPLM